MKFLLWNVHRKPLDDLVVALVRQHKVDVLVLIERDSSSQTLLPALQSVGRFTDVFSNERFAVYVRFDPRCVQRILRPDQSDRMEYWHVKQKNKDDILLVLVHGLDLRNNSEGKRCLFFKRVVDDIIWIETTLNHKRTLVLGDFNANPFDPVVGSVRGLHAIRMRTVNGRSDRNVLGSTYQFFYNPMWGCYGNDRQPPGTFFHYAYDEHELFWHMLDQVVLRPELLSCFQEKSLRILREAETASLLNTQGIPDRINASDHLPVLFRLNLTIRGRTHATQSLA